MGEYQEKPLSRGGRIVVVTLIWAVAIPVLWLLMGWWSLAVMVPGAWASWDYVRTGDMFTQVDHSVSHHVRTGEDGRNRLSGRDANDR